jgi:hypothetical protein
MATVSAVVHAGIGQSSNAVTALSRMHQKPATSANRSPPVHALGSSREAGEPTTRRAVLRLDTAISGPELVGFGKGSGLGPEQLIKVATGQLRRPFAG